MHLLLVNDDGIQAPGIGALAAGLKDIARITVVAPERQRSASSHAITLHKPLRARTVELDPAITAYEINGTPADCVKLALAVLCRTPPDMVISGINAGANMGLDILYSGTASAAAEGALQGIPAIAVSLVDEPFDYAASVRITRLLAEKTKACGLPGHTFLNVNVPPVDYGKLAGIAVTRLGVRAYRNTFEHRVDPLGRDYYWQAGEILPEESSADTDVGAVAANRVSVTPVRFDFTNEALLATLHAWTLRLEGD